MRGPELCASSCSPFVDGCGAAADPAGDVHTANATGAPVIQRPILAPQTSEPLAERLQAVRLEGHVAKFAIGDRVKTGGSQRGVITAMRNSGPGLQVRVQGQDHRILNTQASEVTAVKDSHEFNALTQADLTKAVSGVLFVEIVESIGLPASCKLRFMFDEVHKEAVSASGVFGGRRWAMQ